jgi:hypothetical protein
MDVARLEQLKQDLLNGDLFKHRRLLIGFGLFLVAFWAVTIAGGYFLVTHAMDDNQVSARSVNTPSNVSLLFEGHHPYQLINSIVFLNRVKLAPASDNASLYYAGDDSQKLLVVFHGSSAPADESVANVMGTLRPVSTEILKKWKLSKDELKAIKAQGIYLEADSVKVQKAPQTVAKK